MKLHRLLVLGGAVAAGAAIALSGALAAAPKGLVYSPIFAVLSGGNEVGNSGRANAGDPDGRGAATLLVHGNGKVCFTIVVTHIGKPIAAHVHKAAAGLNGPVIIPLKAPSTGNPGTVGGCVDGISKTLISDLERERGNYYVNVHTTDYPNGAVRGQLH
jgi:hypothetical protein